MPHYETFSLSQAGLTLLADGQSIVINDETGQAILVDWQERRFLAEAYFNESELPVIADLLYDWPSYAPYQKLLTAISEWTPEQATQAIDTARTDETLPAVLAGVQSVLDACRDRLQRFGLEAVPVQQRGYLLTTVMKK